MKRSLFLSFLFLYLTGTLRAQFTYGTTGLLNMPTADMQHEKTAMLGGSFLEKHATPTRWFYNTYNYYINITFFPWLEIAYSCTLHKALKNDPYFSWVPSTYGKFINQDRNFSIRLRAWKEGWWKPWTPQIVLGANDPTTGSWKGGSSSLDSNTNGYYSRFYVAATKHFNWQGEWGIHTAYLYNRRTDYHFNGSAIGVNYYPEIHKPLNLMAEYDSKSVNIGAAYYFWKDHINLIAELNRCKYPSVGIYFKVHLK